ncbi:uncharacterized protein Bfra_009592 [Botrytis fragariae]|uniref:Uncharacterized protein n=1 Tax=Botrytis fragariae TaxID=1964551 RepID=A0A8H6EG94_9HELO|nr:uncharacterized protein Bfra_009592 [Botrytis fragariae]KAF5871036.1 hypothetical protein Bfra_009592 [Botrytis fragariae]
MVKENGKEHFLEEETRATYPKKSKCQWCDGSTYRARLRTPLHAKNFSDTFYIGDPAPCKNAGL